MCTASELIFFLSCIMFLWRLAVRLKSYFNYKIEKEKAAVRLKPYFNYKTGKKKDLNSPCHENATSTPDSLPNLCNPLVSYTSAFSKKILFSRKMSRIKPIKLECKKVGSWRYWKMQAYWKKKNKTKQNNFYVIFC